MPAGGETIMPVQKEQIPLNYNLAPGASVKIYDFAKVTGYITRVDINWPDGCDSLVDVAVGHGVVHFCPREGFRALNDATMVYTFREYVRDDEEVWAEMYNRDAINFHAISVTVIVESVL